MFENVDALRSPVCLNGDWEVSEDKTEDKVAYLEEETMLWRSVSLPADIAHCYPERPALEGVFWFRKSIDIPNGYEGRRIVLHFDAVNYESAIFVNGCYVGSNYQGFLPFEFDISENVKPDSNAQIYVRVDTRRYLGQLPTSFYWKNRGGIIRDVYLYATEMTYVADAYINANIDGSMTLDADIVACQKDDVLSIVIRNDDNIVLAKEIAADIHVHAALKIEDHKLWNPDAPNLYQAEICCVRKGQCKDRIAFKFGFREILTDKGRILLNGEQIFLQGYNRHEDHADVGGARDHDIIRRDFEEIKASGANFIRMCHYPHDEFELDEADRLGLILLVEIPLCAYLETAWGIQDADRRFDEHFNMNANNERTYMNARAMLTRMIKRDRNHPSIAFWSVSNENNEREECVRNNNESLIQIAKSMDPTRLCVHVSMHCDKDICDKFFIRDDVICLNVYPTIIGRLASRNRDYDLKASIAEVDGIISRLKQLYPGKPIVMTEFGYCTNMSVDGSEDERVQADSIRNEFLYYRSNLAGASVWAYADHEWPLPNDIAGHLSTYGLVTRTREKKKAFFDYSELLKSSETAK